MAVHPKVWLFKYLSGAHDFLTIVSVPYTLTSLLLTVAVILIKQVHLLSVALNCLPAV